MPHRHHTVIKGFRARAVLVTVIIGILPALLTAYAPKIAAGNANHSGAHLALVIALAVGWLLFGWVLLYTLLRLQPKCPECGNRMRKIGPSKDEEGDWTIANCLPCRRFFRYRGFGDGIGL